MRGEKDMAFKAKGIIPPIITPTNSDESINFPMLRKMVSYFIDKGVHGLFPIGTTGEFYGMDDEQIAAGFDAVVQESAGRVPVYAGCNSISTRGVLKAVKIAEKAGVDALSILTPMFISQTQEEIYHYYKTISEHTDLPIIIYNNKPKTNVTVEPSTLARLAEIPNIVGIKDSTGDMTNTGEYIRLTRNIEGFSVLVGRDTLILAGLHYGAAGAIASCANIAPELVVSIYEKFMAGDYEGALEAQYILAPLRIACNMGTFPVVIKEGLRLQGFDVGKCMEPILDLTDEQHERLKKIITDMKLI